MSPRSMRSAIGCSSSSPVHRPDPQRRNGSTSRFGRLRSAAGSSDGSKPRSTADGQRSRGSWARSPGGRDTGPRGAAWLVDHLVSVHGVRELWATVEPGNLRSIGLLHSLGFVQQPEPYRRVPESLDDGDLVFAREA